MMPGPFSSVSRTLAEGWRGDALIRAWLACCLFLVAVALVILPALWLDERLLDGVNVWVKPLKFALSMTVHFLTLALLAQWLLAGRPGWVVRTAGYAAVVAMLFEQLYIMAQAARGRRSHFNFDTELESLLYAAMGIFAILLVLASFVLGIAIWRDRKADRADGQRGLRLGAALGLVIGSVLTLAFGGYLSSNSSHWVGQTAGDATGIPITGWSREAGDLRVPHFFATHIMQILPLTGWLLDRARWHPQAGVWFVAVAQTLMVVATFVLALNGHPLLPL